MLKRIYIILFICPLIFPAFGQSKVEHIYYHVGDTLKMDIDYVQNYRNNSISIPVKNKKLTLIEIWSVTCSSCIKGMPLLQRKQQKFGKDIQIILLCADSLERLNILKRRSEIVRNVDLPIITAESSLHKKFRYRAFPTFVWVDREGVIKNLTSAEHKTDDNIHRFIEGSNLNLVEKKDLIGVDLSQPLRQTMHDYVKGGKRVDFFLANKNPEYSYSSRITTVPLDMNSDTYSRIYSFDANIYDIYKFAFGLYRYSSNNRIIVDRDNKAELLPNYEAEGDNRFVFDLNLDVEMPKDQVRQFIKNYFDQLFQVNSYKDTMNVRCLAIRRHSTDIDLSSNFESERFDLGLDGIIEMEAAWDLGILYYLQSRFRSIEGLELFDETGIPANAKVSLSVDTDFRNLKGINKSLLPYGLYIEETEREMEVVVLTGK